MAQRTDASVRHRLMDTDLSAERPDGTTDRRELDPGEVPGALRDVFGIALTAAEAEALIGKVRTFAAAGAG